ncbi:hypothetical protein BKA56DRAFT_635644 [Ilyonectria sp. MPI-CAGE-AT-0026]|nr:hypothetical protein BKA56DRAFT_635644 [Ilyonectria sp. MPI-CAGE-AT-0026]
MNPVFPAPEPGQKPRKLVLCFDGTGNKFHGDDSDSNILKIFRMLNRTANDQYHYYQPGIGTYVISGSLTHTGLRARLSSWYQKAKDSAVGSSFDQHVVGGYRFLMRFYNPGDEIYMFGFSRGAYIARFLAEMLDYIGLLSHGNEEMVKFAWKAFAEWQSREMTSGTDEEAGETKKKRDEMFRFMKGFRETFSRPVGRIRFLGLFDTVNSVPRFETAWMQRSKFPYTARSSAKVIRHAVSIDERRAKFRQDLMYQAIPTRTEKRRHFGEFLDDLRGDLRDVRDVTLGKDSADKDTTGQEERGRRPSYLSPGENKEKEAPDQEPANYAPYRARSKSGARTASRQRAEFETMSNISGIPLSDVDPEDDGQDIDEVWFAGGHADVGGGWEMLEDSKSASHIPLAWMVREAMKAGLPFDEEKVAEMGCCAEEEFNELEPKTIDPPDIPDIRVANGTGGPSRTPTMPSLGTDEKTDVDHSHHGFHGIIHGACGAKIHDSLEFGQGLGDLAVAAWKFMEYLPFRRMDLQSDGSWRPIRWPLPCGEVRDIPSGVRVHGSVIRRMNMDETYRPGNLIIGGGGRGTRKAPPEYGIGEWLSDDSGSDTMAIVLILGIIGNGFPPIIRDNARAIIYTLLSLWTSGRASPAERLLHGKVVLLTGGTSGIGAQTALELAQRGAQLVLLTQSPDSDPFLVEYVRDLRERTNNQLIYAEQVDLADFHSIRKFATKWIDNAPPRRLDMIVLCAATLTPPGGKRKESLEGIEETWMVNFLANFHLLSILSPALRIQPIDRDVRIIIPTCSAYIGSPSLKKELSPKTWSPGTAYARSKLAMNKQLDVYKRPDGGIMNTRLARTPSTRRWLTRGSLWGLGLYLSPNMAAQSILFAAMDGDLGRLPGGKLIKECMEVDFARSEVKDEEVAKKLWEESDALIAKRRAAEKAQVEIDAQKKKEQEQKDEVQGLEQEKQKVAKKKKAKSKQTGAGP